MDTQEQSLLATLAYYGALRWPLTVVELAEHMIPCGGDLHSFGSLVASLELLEVAGRVRGESGLYVVGDVPANIADYRVSRQATSADKWRAMLSSARWLPVVPYVRMMSASGSLAMGSSALESDWDMFVIVRSGRLYTARLGLLAVAWLCGRLRTKRMKTAPDRFCFNHIITTDSLSMRHRSLYTAQAISCLVPFYDSWGYAARFRQANAWVGDYSASAGGGFYVRRELSHSRFLGAIRWWGEVFLNTFIGTLIERGLRRWMQARIRANPETHRAGGRIIADDRELEFHPRSFEAVALARYNETLTRIGLGQYRQRDSGLTR